MRVDPYTPESILVPEEKWAVRPGERFGRLTVKGQPFFVARTIGKTGTLFRNRQHCVCVCECGKVSVVGSNDIKTGNTTSCGCFWRKRVTKHGARSRPGYMRWKNMMQRCYNPNHKQYARYGGRGIRVEEHLQDPNNYCDLFERLLAEKGVTDPENWAMDRACVDGHYSVVNLQLITASDNSKKVKTDRDQKFGQLQLEIVHLKDQLAASYQERFRLEQRLKKAVNATLVANGIEPLIPV